MPSMAGLEDPLPGAPASFGHTIYNLDFANHPADDPAPC
jgi:hypothetical protein